MTPAGDHRDRTGLAKSGCRDEGCSGPDQVTTWFGVTDISIVMPD
jgi:hypothetical protein